MGVRRVSDIPCTGLQRCTSEFVCTSRTEGLRGRWLVKNFKNQTERVQEISDKTRLLGQFTTAGGRGLRRFREKYVRRAKLPPPYPPCLRIGVMESRGDVVSDDASGVVVRVR